MISVLRFTSHRWYHPSPDAAQAGAGISRACADAQATLTGWFAGWLLHFRRCAHIPRRASRSFRTPVPKPPAVFPVCFSASSAYQAPPLRSSGGWSGGYCADRSPSPSLGPLLPGDISRPFPASPPAPAGASFLSVSCSFLPLR